MAYQQGPLLQSFGVPLVPSQQAQPVAAQQQLVDPAALQAAAAARLVPHQQRLRQERQQQRQQQQDPGPALRLSDTGGFVLYCGSKQFHFDSGVNLREPFLRITQVRAVSSLRDTASWLIVHLVKPGGSSSLATLLAGPAHPCPGLASPSMWASQLAASCSACCCLPQGSPECPHGLPPRLQVSGGERNSMVVPWHAITHFQMAISNCAMVHQPQQQPELAAGLQQQVASHQLQAALHGGLQGGMQVQRPLLGPGQVSFVFCHSLTCTSQGPSLSSHNMTPRDVQAPHPA